MLPLCLNVPEKPAPLGVTSLIMVTSSPDAWSDLISRYEGRLLAFVESRLGRRGASEDIVQEAFIGFLNSLPNYDGRRSLEGYLFSICAYKLTDHLRREGRHEEAEAVAGHASRIKAAPIASLQLVIVRCGLRVVVSSVVKCDELLLARGRLEQAFS